MEHQQPAVLPVEEEILDEWIVAEMEHEPWISDDVYQQPLVAKHADSEPEENHEDLLPHQWNPVLGYGSQPELEQSV